jgi:hypothetical protein
MKTGKMVHVVRRFGGTHPENQNNWRIQCSILAAMRPENRKNGACGAPF